MNLNDMTGVLTSNIVVGNVFETVNSLFNQGKGTIIIGVGVVIILLCGFIYWQTKGSWGKTLSTMVLGAVVGWFVVGGYSTIQEEVDGTMTSTAPSVSYGHATDGPSGSLS